MKTPAGARGQGKQRTYLEEDVHTLSAIHALRLEGVSFEKLKGGELAKTLNSKTWTHNPEDFHAENAQDETTQANASLMSVDQQIALMGKYQANEGKLAAVTDERNRLLTELEKERERTLAAEKSASHAAGELAAYKSSWWRNLFKKDE